MAVLLLDIDGTLIEFGAQMPESARKAVHDARAKGHQIFISTGRTLGEIQHEVFDLPLDGILAGTGTYLRVGEQVLYHEVLPPTLVDELVDLLRERGLPFYAETTTGVYPSEDMVAAFQQVLGLDSPEDVTGAWPQMFFGEADNVGAGWRLDTSKLAFRLRHSDDLDVVRGRFGGRAAVEPWSITGDVPDFCEVRVLGSHKGVTIELLAEHLGVPTSQMIGFGDSRGDLEMFALCGISVAMGQATQAVKDAADVVTAPVDEDGLAQAFQTLGLV